MTYSHIEQSFTAAVKLFQVQGSFKSGTSKFKPKMSSDMLLFFLFRGLFMASAIYAGPLKNSLHALEVAALSDIKHKKQSQHFK